MIGGLVFAFLLTNIDSGMHAIIFNKANQMDMHTEEQPLWGILQHICILLKTIVQLAKVAI